MPGPGKVRSSTDDYCDAYCEIGYIWPEHERFCTTKCCSRICRWTYIPGTSEGEFCQKHCPKSTLNVKSHKAHGVASYFKNHGKHHHKVREITFECTYNCSIWNTCRISGAINGDLTKCGPEPAGC